MSNGQSGPSLGDVVSGAAFATGIVVAWLYVAGWTYAYYYFDQFRIPLLMTEVPREHLFVYGGLTVLKNLILAILIAVVLAVLTAVAVRHRRRIGRGRLVALSVAGLAILFVLARQAGIHTAQGDHVDQRATDYGAFPRVIAVPHQPVPTDADAVALRIAASGCARLILFTKERLFLIRPRRDAPALELHTHVIPWSRIGSLTITDDYRSCE